MGNKESSENQTQQNKIRTQQQKMTQLQSQNEMLEILMNEFFKKLILESNDKTSVTIEGKDYEIKEKLGSGAFGVVFKAVCDSNVYAIKRMEINEDNESMVIGEIQFIADIRKKFGNKNLPIISIFGCGVLDDNRLYYAMEYAQGSLADFLSQKKDISCYTFSYLYVLKALYFLESLSIIHNDIKPDNFVCITDPSSPFGLTIKLIDFGTIKSLDPKFSQVYANDIAGTFPYLAPEQFNGIRHIKSDIWSLGIMLYELIYGTLPNHCDSNKNIQIFAISDQEVNFPDNFRPEFKNLVIIGKKCLLKNTGNRSSATDLIDLTRRIEPKMCNLIINETFSSNANIKTFRTKYAQMSSRKCFLADCKKYLPNNHKYNRCDECFMTKCLDCHKLHKPGYSYHRCNECYAIYRQTSKLKSRKCCVPDCNSILTPNYEFNRCVECFDTRCLDCFKLHEPGYKFKRCTDCFAKSRRHR
jgi:serine/threonine protein kinase